MGLVLHPLLCRDRYPFSYPYLCLFLNPGVGLLFRGQLGLALNILPEGLLQLLLDLLWFLYYSLAYVALVVYPMLYLGAYLGLLHCALHLVFDVGPYHEGYLLAFLSFVARLVLFLFGRLGVYRVYRVGFHAALTPGLRDALLPG